MPSTFTAATRDSLSNLAASLGTGRDKAAHDAFLVFDLDRSQVEAMYRGDWLARKVVDIVPYDTVRAWREWSGHRADVARIEAAERRLGLRKALQRAMVLGRLYGGGAILIGDGEPDPARLAEPLDERLPHGGLAFLHAVSRWQLGATALDLNPLSPWCGEPAFYELHAAGEAPLRLHPSRVVRFLGNPLPDPSLSGQPWSDSVLQALYDAVHAAALTTAGATSLMHEAKVDVVTVPNLSEHLSSAETTEQLSARFAYAAAMKSINNLLLLGGGESWARQTIDFGGLPEMVRTFLQVAAGAADIPVTRLLGQSPSGMSATGESDVRNYYDMIAARQELDLRPQLERLDRLICWSEDIDERALSFAFRPLWQLDEPAKAALALSRAQATQVYAGLKLWPDAVMAKLAEAQMVADGTYPYAAAVFAEGGAAGTGYATADAFPVRPGFNPAQPRDLDGRWTAGGGTTSAPSIIPVNQPIDEDPDPTPEQEEEELEEKLKRRADPFKFFRQGIGPDGIVRIPVRPGGGGAPAVRVPPDGGAPEGPESPTTPVSPSTPRVSAPAVTPRGAPQSPAPSPAAGGSPIGSAGTSTPLVYSIKVPADVSLVASGRTIGERATAYEDAARNILGFSPAPPKNKPGDEVPDGVRGRLALEVKYVDDFSGSPRNPDYKVPYPNKLAENEIAQAKRYDDAFAEGVLWVTNSSELASIYTSTFNAIGLTKSRVVVVPSVRK